MAHFAFRSFVTPCPSYIHCCIVVPSEPGNSENTERERSSPESVWSSAAVVSGGHVDVFFRRGSPRRRGVPIVKPTRRPAEQQSRGCGRTRTRAGHVRQRWRTNASWFRRPTKGASPEGGRQQGLHGQPAASGQEQAGQGLAEQLRSTTRGGRQRGQERCSTLLIVAGPEWWWRRVADGDRMRERHLGVGVDCASDVLR